MKTAFFTICDSSIIGTKTNGRNIDFIGFENSFRKFHPDCELLIYDEKALKLLGLNWYNAKATMGNMIINEGYDLVVNVDADHYFFDRCDEILADDYDVACPANFNQTDNLVSIKTTSGLYGEQHKNTFVSEIEFLQGGLIASPNKQFWAHYKYVTDKYYKRFGCLENDTLNIAAYTYPYKVKVLDGGIDYRSVEHRQWYGCSIIGKEQSCYIEDGKIMCEGKPVKAYHFAHGGAKRKYTEVFNAQVSEFIKNNIIN